MTLKRHGTHAENQHGGGPVRWASQEGALEPRLLTFDLPIVYCSYKREVQFMTAYCMKCRKKVEIKNPKQITMKNKRPATQGVCPNCGTKVFRIGKS